MDKVCLVVKSAFQGNLAPMNGWRAFDCADRFLKAQYLKILLGRYSHLLLEQRNKVLLRVSDLLAELVETVEGWLVKKTCHSILDTSGLSICIKCIAGLPQQETLNKPKHFVHRSCGEQLLAQIVELSSKDQICLGDRVGDFTEREGIEGERSALLKGNDQHPAAIPRWDGDRSGAHAAHPGITAGLDFQQGFIIVDMLGAFGQVDDDFCISIRKETIQVVGSAEPIEIDQILDEMVQWKHRLVRVKHHLYQDCFAELDINALIIEHYF